MVEFEFSQHDMYNFDIKTVREERSVDGKRIVTKYKEAIFKNKELESQRIKRFGNKNAPNCLQNVEYFIAPVPYGKYGLGEKYESYGWDFASALLAFKKEYIDGFFIVTGGFFNPESQTEGFVIVDPIKRQEVRKYVEKEFEDFLKNCNEEDFKYAVSSGVSSHVRIGTDRKQTLDQWFQKIMEDYPNGVGEHNNEKWARDLTKEEAAMRLAKKLYHKMDIYNIWGQRTADPLTFESREDAEKFGNDYISWICSDQEERNAKSFDVIVVNDTFNDWTRNEKFREMYKE